MKVSHVQRARHTALALSLASVLVAGCQSSTPAAPAATAVPPTAAAVASPAPAAQAVPTATGKQPIGDGPVLLRDGIALRKVIEVGAASIRLARNPADGAVYVLNPGNGLARVELADPASVTPVATTKDMVGDAVPSGMAFGPDGTLYVVGNTAQGDRTQAVVRRGVADASGAWTWDTLATTALYPLSNTPFDHLFNGIAVSPDGASVFLNSGSRTDHGEVEDNNGAFPDTREVPLTSAIWRLPADARDLALPDDEAGLQPYVFADGTRNSYDLEFAPNGELFAGDNGPDADYPDELNWLREGQHYGFPWRFGSQDNPQQFPDYDSSKDVRLSDDFTAVQIGAYANDPGFPKPPGPFTNPVANTGPDATQYRGDDGQPRDAAAEGQPLDTFTPHRSPLGLVFATAASMPDDLRGDDTTLSAFILSWGSAGGTLSDKGQDLLHMALTRQGDAYQAVTTQVARGFKNPIDALLIDNKLYVLDYSGQGAIWELTFE